MKSFELRIEELRSAATDIIATAQGIVPAQGGNLVRLAHLAEAGITSQREREMIACALLDAATRCGIDSRNLRATAAGLITRCDRATA